jgi:hypothetical protein
MNFDHIKDVVNTHKQLFASYIADTTEPLEERWQAFCDAPEYLKNDMGYMCSKLHHYFGEDAVSYDGPVYIERYQERTSEDVVESLECHFEDQGLPPEEVTNRVNAIKEKILADNFGRFTYDW